MATTIQETIRLNQERIRQAQIDNDPNRAETFPLEEEPVSLEIPMEFDGRGVDNLEAMLTADMQSRNEEIAFGDGFVAETDAGYDRMQGGIVDKTNQSSGSNIDWGFISQMEGNKLQGYVPDASGSKSGVTIGSGFDLGQRNIGDLEGLPQGLIDKLEPYLGLGGDEATAVAGELNLTDTEGNAVNEFARTKALDKLQSNWYEATGTDFSTLPEHKATALASVAFQYGDLEKATPNFWKQVTSDDWEGAITNLDDFGDRYGTRRHRERDLLTGAGI